MRKIDIKHSATIKIFQADCIRTKSNETQNWYDSATLMADAITNNRLKKRKSHFSNRSFNFRMKLST